MSIVDAMFASYGGGRDVCIYGPICVSSTQRGQGLARLMYKELLHQGPNREGILFIKSGDEASLRAHEKMGINNVSSFVFNTANFEEFAYSFSLKKE